MIIAGSVLGGCTGTIDTNTPEDAPVTPPDITPFEAATPATYVTKVKNLLIGLPATDDEIAQVVADPHALAGLIDQWMMQPAFEERALDFFRNAFQQNGVTFNALITNAGLSLDMEGNARAKVEASLMDSFPKTVWELVNTDQPLTKAINTDTYMLTTAQMVLLSYVDEVYRTDTNALVSQYVTRGVSPSVTFDPAITATYAQSIDPTNASFMKFKDRAVPTGTCQPTARTDTSTRRYERLFDDLFGRNNCFNPTATTNTNPVINIPPLLTDTDFTDWRPVRISTADTTTPSAPQFWDVPAMRTAGTMSLHTARRGFSGTLAFAANWGSNKDNSLRVTANQMLIVGIGRSIIGSSTVVAFPVDATAADHSADPACAGCHNQLDPMRQFLRQSWTYTNGRQTDATQNDLAAQFQIDGVTSGGTGAGDLTNILASHPRFALAWTQKLYFWATSRPADETDPELQRVAKVFSDSNFNFKVLVRELLSSPIVTYAEGTKTTVAAGNTFSTIRRDQLCTALANRLGIPNVCTRGQIPKVGTLIAADTYYRSYELPSLPTDPDLFFRASLESVCGEVSKLVVDPAAGAMLPNKYPSSDPTTAIADMVTTVMAILPSDPRHAQALQILTEDYTANKAVTGVSAADALRSTFQAACLSPTSAIVGL